MTVVRDESAIPDMAGRLRLDGRGMVVLGAGQGMGRHSAHALSQAGARVVCVDLQPELAEQVAGEVGGVALSGDVTTREDLERVFAEAVTELGTLHGVVDVVGMARWSPLLEMEDELWDSQFAICLRHAFLTAQIAGRAMSATGGGAMAFVTSASGITGAANHAAYGAAKAALISLVKSAGVELAPLGVRVNAVAPGIVMTARLGRTLFQDADYHAAQVANVPLGRLGDPADIAGALLFLVSDLAGYMTGETIQIDGGVQGKFGYAVPRKD
jgi:NAD(P)-dependent dehydrogenase (short-subunit alcohol dehydrogenase family)